MRADAAASYARLKPPKQSLSPPSKGSSMPLRVRLVVVMDPIEAIKPAKDSTLAILLAAQASGWQLFYAEQKHVWLRDGVAWGRLAPLQVFDDPGTWFVRGEAQSAKLGEFDV